MLLLYYNYLLIIKYGILKWLLSSIWFTICYGSHIKNPIIQDPVDVERYHYPGAYTTVLPEGVNNSETRIPSTNFTPDFRLEEPHFTVFSPTFWKEMERPYRLSPHFKQTYRYDEVDNANNLGCYCCTVFKRHIVLATCGVITTRHLITTATSTEVVLRNYRRRGDLEGILGAWYDTDMDTFNSSLYATPARIHYHPMYRHDFEVNVSHPIPCMYDIAVWAMTYNFYGGPGQPHGAIVCQRSASGWQEYTHTTPRPNDLHMIVGFLFMKAYGRRPLPWFKYGVRTKQYLWPCPKSEWHWFHCVAGDWAKFGMDSGGAMHFMNQKRTFRVDGFSGMCAFSMKLRSKQIVHYFTVLDTHPVLDFLYDAYMGRLAYEYLDSRFWDTQWAAPRLYYGEMVNQNYEFGVQNEYYFPPNYRRKK